MKIFFASFLSLLPILLFPLEPDDGVQIKYYGHSCFEFICGGRRILVDPFTPDWFDYQLPQGRIDLAFSSHEARDHRHFDGLQVDRIYCASGERNEFQMLANGCVDTVSGRQSESFQGHTCEFWTVPSFHDDIQGLRNGVNGILCFDFDSLRIVHLGDIGHVLEPHQIQAIGPVDVLMIPIDAYHIIPLPQAKMIVDHLHPRIVIPMHYHTDRARITFDPADLDNFLAMFPDVRQPGTSRVTLRKQDLPAEPYLLVLNYLSDDEHE
ncbi:MAG: MBL fold metallo-hydrolase [Fidelibacterota bacterium]|nr:MAG: MBL fold metallo-hydrolase [Candidatus Neomarinimicrobiota bacterium]